MMRQTDKSEDTVFADHDGAATRRDYDLDSATPAFIAAQAQRAPDRIAVECNGSALSYGELEQQASAIAQALQARGVGRGELVGICMPRSVDMLAALLGIMKSGAAYVPLDPAFPAERLRYMAEHAGIRHVVVASVDATPEVIAQGRDLLKLAGLDLAGAPQKSALPSVGGNDLAYVLYTSGSTGKPKGVRVLHRNLVNFLTAMRERPGIDAGDVLCAVTTLSFDIAGLELYLPLTVGARIVLATEPVLADPHALMRLMRERDVTLLQTTPSLLRLLLDGGRIEDIQGLKLLVGGEALPRDLSEAVLPRCRELWNLYGPTETTIWSTVQRVEHGDGSVPLGTPIANTSIYVLDAKGSQMSPGTISEIWIGGEGVADGYLHQPELTAERFLSDPFGSDGSRMYRTGDLGSLRDGVLYFHGRCDDQIKLRGYRIEPGDIEAAALAEVGVREAVVVMREFGPNDRRLVLYINADDDGGVSARLREHLRAKLPAYMLPHHIEVLDALPKTPNGKIDRKSLPQPGESPITTKTKDSGALALDGLERTFMTIWRDTLHVGNIGLNDNFFDLGGDSLTAVRVFQRIQELTGVNLPLATLLGVPTVAGQAAAFRTAVAEKPTSLLAYGETGHHDPWGLLVPVNAQGSCPPLFCVHGVGGNVLNYLPLARALGEDQPFYGVQAVGLDGVTAPLGSLTAMAERYVTEIRSAQPRGPYFLAGGSMGGMIAYEIAHQLRAAGEEIALLALFDTYGPGNRLFEIERAGSLERFGHHWRDRWKRVRRLEAAERRSMLMNAMRWRVQRIGDIAHVRWSKLQGTALPHALRYRAVERSNEKAYFAYKPKPYAGWITLFRATQHPPEMAASRTLGWEKVSTAGIEVIDLPGDHATLIEQPELVTSLRAVLQRAQTDAARDLTGNQSTDETIRVAETALGISVADSAAAPLVSVVIPVYNGESYLADALDSALAQTCREFEIIVVDDGSNDSSGRIADRYAQNHPTRVRVIHQPNGGQGAARNTAIGTAHGRYIALLDADDIWMPNHLVEALAVLEREPHTGLVHARTERIDGNGRSLGMTPLSWDDPDDAFTALLLRRAHVLCSTAVFRRTLIEQVGGFDPAFNRLGCEDRDLWLRIARATGLHHLDSLHARYRIHRSNISSNQKLMLRGRYMLVDQYAAGTHGALRYAAIAAIHSELGDYWFYGGKRMAALAAYTRAILRSPLMGEAWRGIARCLLKPMRAAT